MRNMTKKIFSIGNFALSNIYVEKNQVARDAFCGTNYRVALACALLSQPLSCFSKVGPEPIWNKLFSGLKRLGVECEIGRELEQTIRFNWHYKDHKLFDLDSEGLEQMALITTDFNKRNQDLSDFDLINVCPLGFDNERLIINRLAALRKKTIISYIFHYSNLGKVAKKEYLDLFESVDYLFLNEVEALSLTDSKKIDQAGEILSQRAKTCVITQGDRGVQVYHKAKKRSSLKSMQMNNVVDTSGAGDIFAGGVIVGLANGKSIEAACRQGTILAGASTTNYLTKGLESLVL
ncbi:MAG: hypothetical protein GF381_01025 [Candidatus Pacebacteria bacterium]|nr:hypothetical protein [Candidatus Paceibacterota bacterium]